MYIVSKDRLSIVNTDQVQVFYVGADSCSIKATLKDGKGCQLGKYCSIEECKAAMDIMAVNLSKAGVCNMPDDKAVIAKINQGVQKQHHIDGKKAKGHGGS